MTHRVSLVRLVQASCLIALACLVACPTALAGSVEFNAAAAASTASTPLERLWEWVWHALSTGWDGEKTTAVLITLAFGLVQLRAAILNRFNAQVGAFKQMRESFALVRADLPPDFCRLTELPQTGKDMQILQRYWQHAFDEWFITQKLHPWTLGTLWRDYYREAILHARESPVMVAALLQAQEDTGCRVDDEFVMVVLRRKLRKNRFHDVKDKCLRWHLGKEVAEVAKGRELQQKWKDRYR